MTDRLTIALAQINPTVGNLPANLDKLRGVRARAAAEGADLVVATELCVSGYPPEDLVLKPDFLDAVQRGVEALAAETADGGPALLIGAPWRLDPEARAPLRGKVYNAALLLDGGEIRALRTKHHLPNYGVFDEIRVFAPGPLPGPVNFRGVRLGVMVCEDMWFPDVAECLEESGAEILVVPNGSPYESDKSDERLQLAVERVVECGLPLIYVNQVGGQDELVFDGASFVVDAGRNLKVQLPEFVEALSITRWSRGPEGWSVESGDQAPPGSGMEPVYRALMLGLRDYVTKSGFPGIVLGLSGGIDSAISAVIAADALGPERVHCVMMPSPYTSRESLDDAAELARLNGLRLDEIDIGPAMQAYEGMLRPLFDSLPPDTTEENLQSRARGITLMAISNKFGPMVLSTGNKSEMSVGYATLYGDMCGGFNVLKDVYKTTVFQLSRWRNQARPADALGADGRVIPERIITKPPSAELKPDQKDEDSLPPYPVLDDILSGLIEQEASIDAIVGRGHPRETVNRVWRLLENAEYKRRQAPPGVKITRRSFGRDRRYPIVNAFKGPG
ncbi:NH(3)-dependent NAD(+) synthetase [Tistlia consotensis]|uniref:Glutamine-dependent NAD(+) synthetase n=1 Tax=Tistlia consotensis USBA 355 TaxID=560819 RepID=A0A1Y6CS76_9PROT|nr:NAD+ synthase [Tistlia consotensis]SMF84498.1 NH(3)-dependent NAD(+) synthetase [Tistlia consotensis USBA 355]SNS36404.1 NH(3)-dependent NAD(+) synthetase [Tistlia consotensis]